MAPFPQTNLEEVPRNSVERHTVSDRFNTEAKCQRFPNNHQKCNAFLIAGLAPTNEIVTQRQ